MSRQVCGIAVAVFDHASGTSMVLAIGAERPARTSASNTASSAAESEEPEAMIGLMSSAVAEDKVLAIRISWDFIQLVLPFSVLISPLCASIRKGWASHHCGKVLVE